MNPDDYLRHEAIDRCWMFADMMAGHLVEHAFFDDQPEKKAKLEQAFTLIMNVYNEIGNEHCV